MATTTNFTLSMFRQRAFFKYNSCHGSNISKLLSRSFQTSPSFQAKTEVEKLNVNGINLHWKRYGSGPHVVLISPALVGSGARYRRLIPKLNMEKFTYITWDPPGFGKSRPPNRNVFTGEFPILSDARLAGKLMEGLGYTRYSAIGWSDGGTTSALIASEYPDKIRKVVTCNSVVRYDARVKYFLDATSNLNNWTKEQRSDLLEDYEESYFNQMLKDWIKFNEQYGHTFTDLISSKLQKIKAPTMYIQSANDTFKYQNPTEVYQTNVAICRIHRIPYGGHDYHEFLDDFVKATEDFLLAD